MSQLLDSPRFITVENDVSADVLPYGGRSSGSKLEAIISALLWKRDTKKDCRVYDASGTCLYDTALSNETLELDKWAS